jgi:signal peptidase I
VDFALILFVLSIVTGILWCYDVFKARKQRPEGTPDPWWVEYGASFFVVILPIFLLRSFVIEPFRIPSGSMVPTLLVGDFILVNKFTYGIRLPILNKKIIEVNTPKRGDVMVFRYPHDTTQDFIKRVVGLPGDKIEYINKHLKINGVEMPAAEDGKYWIPGTFDVYDKYQENLDGHPHAILTNPNVPPYIPQQSLLVHAYSSNCTYTLSGVTCVVPPGHYFMMGDNRDQSADSRYWGFVPEENIIGRAFLIWFHADRILPLPGGVDFGRVGGFH